MAVLMYDSVTAGDIPSNVPMVAGYVDRGGWTPADWARFTTPRKVRIATHASTNSGDVLDVEKWDATPDQAPGWIRMRQAAGLWRPTIYCEKSAIGAVKDHCLGLEYDIWYAEYNGQQHCDPGFVACQYADPQYGSGGHYDLSWVIDSDWPHRTAPQPGEDDMANYVIRDAMEPGGDPEQVAIVGGVIVPIASPEDRQILMAAPVNAVEVAVSHTQFEVFKAKAHQ